MLFNSIEFAIFLPIVFILYWSLKKSVKAQNILLLLSSYLFYGWWDWRFLSLIIFSSFIDYFIGLSIARTNLQERKKILLWSSIIINLGFLGFFKYFNFFAESFSQAFTLMGTSIETSRLNIILPVGISFYTFQTLSYSIDVYNKKLKPTKNIIEFFTFVSFFPQLVAGPIERAKNLLPQFKKKRNFDYNFAVSGARQILWGLLKKIVIADNCAVYANQIFNNSSEHNGSTLLIGAVFFTFQIYGDFSGYSDIAIGTSKLFGFKLERNFAFPYFSRDIAEFWRRWHISLSTWFRDYLYIPLGGSKGSKKMQIRNVFIIFIVSGFWHGANWTFIVWGILNALYFLPLLLINKNRVNTTIVAEGKLLPTLKEFFKILITFGLTVLAWVVFRAESLTHAFNYLSTIFSRSIFSLPFYSSKTILTAVLIFFFVTVEWVGREKEFAIENLNLMPFKGFRWLVYFVIISVIYFFGYFENDLEFIYFQF